MSLTPEQMNKLMAELNSLGEVKVRRLMAEERWGKPTSLMRTHVEDWLEAEKVEREIEAASVAREAALVASRAKNAAIIAAVAAIIAAITSIINFFLS